MSLSVSITSAIHSDVLSDKHRSRHQNCHPKCFSLKVMVKDISLHNGGQRDTFVYVTRSNRPRCFFHLLKGSDPSYLALNFSNILPINN